MFNKRWSKIALIAVFSLSLLGCGSAGASTSKSSVSESKTDEEDITLTVFAAASMTETLEEIQGLYKEVAPGVTLTFNFDSSGTLKTQIQEGADCDLFISAGQKQVDELDIKSDANPDSLDFVLQGSRLDLLKNEVTLCVPDGNPKAIESFDSLAEKFKSEDILFAMGNADVPVGQYTQKILQYYDLDEASLSADGHITYGSNVKEVTTWVKEGSVDAGVVYATDAFSTGLDVVDKATTEMCGEVIYPAAVINTTKHEEAAKDFLTYLQGEDAGKVFEGVGFTVVK